MLWLSMALRSVLCRIQHHRNAIQHYDSEEKQLRIPSLFATAILNESDTLPELQIFPSMLAAIIVSGSASTSDVDGPESVSGIAKMMKRLFVDQDSIASEAF